MHENRNLFLFLIDINNIIISIICTTPDTFYQYPRTVFVAGAVFRDIGIRVTMDERICESDEF